jgi:hypothetical protein
MENTQNHYLNNLDSRRSVLSVAGVTFVGSLCNTVGIYEAKWRNQPFLKTFINLAKISSVSNIASSQLF